jgi:hypothetical protein
MIQINVSGQYETTNSNPKKGFIIWRLWRLSEPVECLALRAVVDQTGRRDV